MNVSETEESVNTSLSLYSDEIQDDCSRKFDRSGGNSVVANIQPPTAGAKRFFVGICGRSGGHSVVAK